MIIQVVSIQQRFIFSAVELSHFSQYLYSMPFCLFSDFNHFYLLFSLLFTEVLFFRIELGSYLLNSAAVNPQIKISDA
jgi:hypothetical protein